MSHLNRAFIFLATAMVSVTVGRQPAWSAPQQGAGHGPLAHIQEIEKQEWRVFGRVVDLNGDGVSGAKVRLDVGGGAGSVKKAETDPLGRFSEVFDLVASQYKSLHVKILVTRAGYRDANTSADFPSGKTWEIDVTLLGAHENPFALSQSGLTERLKPRLAAARDALPDKARRRYDEEAARVFGKGMTPKSVSGLARFCAEQADSVDCATLLALARLQTGDWKAATGQAARAAEANGKSPHPRPEPLLILGALESWQHQPKKAATFFLEALKIHPNDPIALEELGRSQFEADNYEEAERDLAEAIQAGAPADARLLRVRALMGMDDLLTAEQEMDRYAGGRKVRDLPQHARALYETLQNRRELSGYGQVKSFLTESLGEISEAVPELKGITPAASQQALPAILEKTGRAVADFFSHFPDTISREDVRQETMKKNNKLAGQSDQKFRYLLMSKSQQKGLGLEEYRTNDQGDRVEQAGLEKGFMLTSGFASVSLIFHPAYQSDSDFRLLGTQELEGHPAQVVAFAQNPGRAEVTELFRANRETAWILIQGIAWVDESSSEILRMRTDLLKPAAKVRLARQTTEIEYGPVAFKQAAREYWLPHEVVVTVDWRGRKYRNRHEYSDFRLFNVNAEERRKTSELRP